MALTVRTGLWLDHKTIKPLDILDEFSTSCQFTNKYTSWTKHLGKSWPHWKCPLTENVTSRDGNFTSRGRNKYAHSLCAIRCQSSFASGDGEVNFERRDISQRSTHEVKQLVSQNWPGCKMPLTWNVRWELNFPPREVRNKCVFCYATLLENFKVCSY